MGSSLEAPVRLSSSLNGLRRLAVVATKKCCSSALQGLQKRAPVVSPDAHLAGAILFFRANSKSMLRLLLYFQIRANSGLRGVHVPQP